MSQAREPELSKLILLDRDGTINEATDHSYCDCWYDWQWTYRAPWAMKALVDAGYKLVIVTSQSGIAKGQYNENSFLGVMLMAEMAMADILGADGYWPTLVCACYHQESDQCECRKPKTLHWYQKIVPYFGPISLDDSWMVGDRFTDVAFGRKIGLSTAKIPDQYTSLHDFAETLLSREIPDHG